MVPRWLLGRSSVVNAAPATNPRWNTQNGLFGEADGYSPDDDFDYDEFISREFPEEASPLSKHVLKRLAVTLVALLAGLALFALADLVNRFEPGTG